MTQKFTTETVNAPVTFKAEKDSIVAVFQVGFSTFGVRFTSPEHLLSFAVELMEKAAIVWPDNEWIKEWKSD